VAGPDEVTRITTRESNNIKKIMETVPISSSEVDLPRSLRRYLKGSPSGTGKAGSAAALETRNESLL
jgi:hypothetical protein